MQAIITMEFCHSCTQEEYAKGGWRPRNPIEIKVTNATLQLREDKYLPRGNDVFIRSDGFEMIYFGRNEQKEVSFFVFSDGWIFLIKYQCEELICLKQIRIFKFN